jgi:hypothetical protein
MHGKTKEPCDCGVISAMLNNPSSGLTLEDNTFLLGDQWHVYHCPFCGGLLPHSRKPIWYPQLTDNERVRLEQLVEGITTAEEAIQRIGPPDYDALVDVDDLNVQYSGGGLAKLWTDSEELPKKCRNVKYYNLSETADIEFYFYVDDVADYRIEVKFISPRHVVSD